MLINILNDLKKNLKCKNRNLSNENDKTANNSYLTKIIKKHGRYCANSRNG